MADVAPMPGPCPDTGGCFLISGFIGPTDLVLLRPIIERALSQRLSMTFRLNSRGGDVRTAIELAKWMRRLRATAVGGQSDVCLSSCVFLLAGATSRIAPGTVGIHRPFSTDTGAKDYDTAQREYRELQTLVRMFFQDMNVSDTLYDAMLRVPPENIRVLTRDELLAFGLEGLDPVQQEILDSSEAQRYGISRAEYLRRKALAAQACDGVLQAGQFTAFWECDERIKSSGKR
ncbi:hypothetical protein GPA22_08720 [Aromatoleum toluvorans]|uniref:ATP-dependent Clp protease proteolytic subunit n=1 Tax=Aromatoleum toluvorans TaxID=92002 RepID=A0ABX1PYV8_9RHOO|nr:hypothetical protein [Aromatoleum toluvorans]NMG43812.1 hypothetical protein [Aromatoleum toluvorans]